MHNIVIADEQAIFRETLKHTLNASGKYHVISEAGAPSNMISLLSDSVSIVVLDIKIDGYDIYDLIRRIRLHHPKIKIVILSIYAQEHVVRNALAAGIDAYVSKNACMEELFNALERVLAGHKYISTNISEMLVDSLSGNQKLPHSLLTSRELHVLTMLGKGFAVKKIAADLQLSAKTISSHKSRIMQKMNLANNAELIKYFINSELNDSAM